MKNKEEVIMSSEEKKELAEIFGEINTFFESSKFEIAIEESRKYVIEVSEYIHENIRVEDKVLSQPFTI